MINELLEALIGLIVALIDLCSMSTCIYSMSATFLDKQAAAGDIALINATGCQGGLVGSYAVGWLAQGRDRLVYRCLLGIGCMLRLAALLAGVPDVLDKRNHDRGAAGHAGVKRAHSLKHSRA